MTLPMRDMAIEQPTDSELFVLKTKHLPRILPSTWRIVQDGADGCAYECPSAGIRVIVGFERHLDGKLWQHLSCSHKDGIPHWTHLVQVKEMFMGRDSTALQIIPPRDKYVNIHPDVLHLWRCLDGDVTPDFTQGKGSI